MLFALGINDPELSKREIIDVAKKVLYGFYGEQVSLVKYYHKYESYSEAGYIFIYNGKQDMEGLTTKSLDSNMRLKINKQYLNIDEKYSDLFRRMDSESKGLRTIEYKNDFENSNIIESHYEIWSEYDICRACRGYIATYIFNKRDKINIQSFVGFDAIVNFPEGRRIDFLDNDVYLDIMRE